MQTRLFLAMACSLAPGCSNSPSDTRPPATPDVADEERVPTAAIATLTSTAGVEGSVTFEPTSDGVAVVARVEGLSPGPHGFHIHETGDCSAPDFSSAGGHFNPHGHAHGSPADTERHVGDLGNLDVDASGLGRLEATHELELDGVAPDTIIGKAVIIHQSADDLESQPSGAAGPRVACGVIERVGDSA